MTNDMHCLDVHVRGECAVVVILRSGALDPAMSIFILITRNCTMKFVLSARAGHDVRATQHQGAD